MTRGRIQGICAAAKSEGSLILGLTSIETAHALRSVFRSGIGPAMLGLYPYALSLPIPFGRLIWQLTILRHSYEFT